MSIHAKYNETMVSYETFCVTIEFNRRSTRKSMDHLSFTSVVSLNVIYISYQHLLYHSVVFCFLLGKILRSGVA